MLHSFQAGSVCAGLVDDVHLEISGTIRAQDMLEKQSIRQTRILRSLHYSKAFTIMPRVSTHIVRQLR